MAEAVLRCDRSSVVSPEQFWNIWYMSVTCDVSKPERSSVVSPEHVSNMRFIRVTLVVENEFGNAIVESERQPTNMDLATARAKRPPSASPICRK